MSKTSDDKGLDGKEVSREGLISRFFHRALRWNFPLERREILGFLYFFLVITSYYIVKPLRASRFLTDLGAENIPYFYLLNSFLVFIIVYGYNFVVDLFKGRKRLFFFAVNGFLAVNILCFAFLFMIAQAGESDPAAMGSGSAVSTQDLLHKLYPVLAPLIKGRRLTVAFFIWASFFSVFVVSVFWSLMSELFTSEEGKRSYAFIGLGGVLGGALGGKLAEELAGPLGESWLLVLSAGILGACTLMTGTLVDASRLREDAARPGDVAIPEESTGPGKPVTGSSRGKVGTGFSIILEDGYVRAIAAIVMFMTMAGTLFDFQLNTICQTTIHEKFGLGDLMASVAGRRGAIGALDLDTIDGLRRDGAFEEIDAGIVDSVAETLKKSVGKGISGRESVDRAVTEAFKSAWTGNIGKFAGPGFEDFSSDIEGDLKSGLKNATTSFFGWVFGTVSLVSFLVQLFLTARLQQTIGIPASLSVLPAICLPGLALLFFAPVLGVISLLTVIQNGLSYSLMQSSREQLYIPVSDEVRYKAKPFIDTFIFRFGDAIACLAILIGTGPAGLGLVGLTAVNSVIVITWAVSVRYCGAKYSERISGTAG